MDCHFSSLEFVTSEDVDNLNCGRYLCRSSPAPSQGLLFSFAEPSLFLLYLTQIYNLKCHWHLFFTPARSGTFSPPHQGLSLFLPTVSGSLAGSSRPGSVFTGSEVPSSVWRAQFTPRSLSMEGELLLYTTGHKTSYLLTLCYLYAPYQAYVSISHTHPLPLSLTHTRTSTPHIHTVRWYPHTQA